MGMRGVDPGAGGGGAAGGGTAGTLVVIGGGEGGRRGRGGHRQGRGAGAVTVASVRWLLSSFVMDRLQRSKGPYMQKLHPVPGI